MRFIAALLTTTLLVGCAGSSNYTDPRKATSRWVRDNIKQVRHYLSNASGCNDLKIPKARGTQDALIDELVSLNRIQFSDTSTVTEKQTASDVRDIVETAVIRNQFFLAEKLRKMGCVKPSKEEYMTIINVFSGTKYNNIRQKAQMAIEDMRE